MCSLGVRADYFKSSLPLKLIDKHLHTGICRVVAVKSIRHESYWYISTDYLYYINKFLCV